jgi:predicted metalloprotease with PDZ domain
VAQASFDAWTRYYRIQENTPNATVSYYTKGALVALCLDLTLRQHGSSLDHALRALWQRCQGGPMTEADLRAVLAQGAGRPLDAELDAWVHSTAELPVVELLKAHGVQVDTEPAPLAQRLGLRVAEANGITLKNVLRGGLAEQAGMASGDEWLAVECAPGETWRITKLDDIAPLLGARPHLHALVSRDRRVLRLPLAWPQAGDTAPGQTVVKFTPGPAPTPTASAWPARLG